MSRRAVAVTFWVFNGVAALVSNLVYARYGYLGGVELVYAVGAGALAAWWYERDARVRDVYSSGYHIFVFCVLLLAIPIYLIRSRGWREGGLSLLRIAGLTVATFGGVYVIESAVYALTGAAG